MKKQIYCNREGPPPASAYPDQRCGGSSATVPFAESPQVICCRKGFAAVEIEAWIAARRRERDAAPAEPAHERAPLQAHRRSRRDRLSRDCEIALACGDPGGGRDRLRRHRNVGAASRHPPRRLARWAAVAKPAGAVVQVSLCPTTATLVGERPITEGIIVRCGASAKLALLQARSPVALPHSYAYLLGAWLG